MTIELRGNRYTVRYYYKGKHRRLSDKGWTKDLGRKQMKRLAESAVLADMKRIDGEEMDRADETESMKSLAEKFFEQMELSVKSGTAYHKRLAFGKYIATSFDMDAKPSKAITPEAVNAFRIKASEGKKSETTNHTLALFREFIDWLCLMEKLDYATGTKIKMMCKSVSKVNEVNEKDNFWTPSEWNAFIGTFDSSKREEFAWKVLFETTYWCALRFGEVLAVQWGDFDFGKMTLTVKRSRDNQGKVSFPKTASSNAMIQVRGQVIEDLKKFRAMNGDSKDTDYVFDASRTTTRRIMDRHIKAAGVKHITVHGLRHSMASRMINAGVNILTVSRQLRHSSPDMTLHTYSHLFPNTDRGAIDKI